MNTTKSQPGASATSVPLITQRLNAGVGGYLLTSHTRHLIQAKLSKLRDGVNKAVGESISCGGCAFAARTSSLGYP